MFKGKEKSATEKLIREFSDKFCRHMGWPNLNIKRFKVGGMKSNRGYCMALDNDDIYIIISNNPDVYHKHADDKHFWNAVVHELIHAYLYRIGAKITQAFGHGKAFKNVAKEIAFKTDNQFSYKDIMK